MKPKCNKYKPTVGGKFTRNTNCEHMSGIEGGLTKYCESKKECKYKALVT